MPSPCDACKVTCEGGKSNCGENCKCGDDCKCAEGKDTCGCTGASEGHTCAEASE